MAVRSIDVETALPINMTRVETSVKVIEKGDIECGQKQTRMREGPKCIVLADIH